MALKEKIVSFPTYKKTRKKGVNAHRKGSVRKLNGKVWVDFVEADGVTAFSQLAKFEASGNSSENLLFFYLLS